MRDNFDGQLMDGPVKGFPFSDQHPRIIPRNLLTVDTYPQQQADCEDRYHDADDGSNFVDHRTSLADFPLPSLPLNGFPPDPPSLTPLPIHPHHQRSFNL
jgi:hypothetical protein